MKRIKRIVAILLLALTLTACEELSQMANQAAQVINLKNCTFDVNSVNNIKMLNFDLTKGLSMEDLNVQQVMRISQAVVNKKLPVSFDVNLDVNNPNTIAASLGKMDYIISLNGKEVINSTFTNGFSIAPNSKGQVTLPISTDLFQLFTEETKDAILNLAFKLAGASSDPVYLGVKVRPYITVNNQTLAYPDYITINKALQ